MISPGYGSRVLVGGGLLAALFLAAVTWLVLLSPVRSDTQTLRDDTAAVESQNVVLQSEAVTLADQSENREQLVADARQSLSALPPGTELPSFNRQLVRQSRAQGVTLTSLSIGASSTSATTAQGTASALTIPLTLQSSGTLLQQLAFLRDLQQVGPRLALISSSALAPGQAGSSLETSSVMTVQLTVFATPMSAEARTQLTDALHDRGAD